MLDEILFQLCTPQLPSNNEPAPTDAGVEEGPLAPALSLIVGVALFAVSLLALVAR